MNSKAARYALLIAQILISLVIFSILVLGISEGETMRPMVTRSIPCSVQTTANLLFSVILFFGLRKTGMVELSIAPFLLLSTSLENIRIFSYYAEYSHAELISSDVLAALFLFSLLLSLVMFCGLSFTFLSRSLISVNHYILAGIVGVVLVMAFGPRISDAADIRHIAVYRMLIIILFSTAVVSFAAGILTNLHTYNIGKQVALLGLTVGDFMLSMFSSAAPLYIGLVIFTACEIFLTVMIRRGNRSMGMSEIIASEPI
ncbi:MAG: hypothetical protein J5785_05425 [Spirochaetales bacterium]|nr:hypothetical protein [Spirochaetales bacterium]